MEPDPSQSPVETLLTDYAEALGSLPPTGDLSSRQVLRVLRSRDRLQSALTESLHLADDQLARLTELDLTLKQHSDRLSSAENLDQLRQSLQPSDSAWWWHLSPPDPKPARFSKFDWLWNLGTVASLVLATSFATQTAKAFSTEGFDFFGNLEHHRSRGRTGFRGWWSPDRLRQTRRFPRPQQPQGAALSPRRSHLWRVSPAAGRDL